MKPAGYAPVYCALYPEFAEVARKHGYAMAVHGSMQRDFDLICIPWTDKPSDPSEMLKEITTKFAIRLIGGAECKNHGRIAYTVSIEHGNCALDISFMPKRGHTK